MIDNCFSGNTVAGLVYIDPESGVSLLVVTSNYKSGNSIDYLTIHWYIL